MEGETQRLCAMMSDDDEDVRGGRKGGERRVQYSSTGRVHGTDTAQPGHGSMHNELVNATMSVDLLNSGQVVMFDKSGAGARTWHLRILS